MTETEKTLVEIQRVQSAQCEQITALTSLMTETRNDVRELRAINTATTKWYQSTLLKTVGGVFLLLAAGLGSSPVAQAMVSLFK